MFHLLLVKAESVFFYSCVCPIVTLFRIYLINAFVSSIYIETLGMEITMMWRTAMLIMITGRDLTALSQQRQERDLYRVQVPTSLYCIYVFTFTSMSFLAIMFYMCKCSY